MNPIRELLKGKIPRGSILVEFVENFYGASARPHLPSISTRTLASYATRPARLTRMHAASKLQQVATLVSRSGGGSGGCPIGAGGRRRHRDEGEGAEKQRQSLQHLIYF
jgi:hypothetical protein